MLLEMALPRVCLVEGCYTAASPIISKFIFPKNKEICSKWVDFTGNLALLDYWEERQLMGKHLGTHCRICALHFRQEDFSDICKIKLKRGVVPSLNGPLTTEGKPEIATDSYSTPIPSLSSSCSDELSQGTFCANEVGDIELADLDDPCLPINSLKSLNSLKKNEIKTHFDSDAMRSECVPTPCFSKRVCLVEGCYSTNKTKGVRLFCFPTKKEICSKWVEFTGSLRLLDDWEKGLTLSMNSRICSRHFHDEDYESDWKIKLKDDVIPSLNGQHKIKIEVEPENDNVSHSSPFSPLFLNCSSTGNPSFDTSFASDVESAAFCDPVPPSSHSFQNNSATPLNSDAVISTCGTNICKIEQVFSVGRCELLKQLESDSSVLQES